MNDGIDPRHRKNPFSGQEWEASVANRFAQLSALAGETILREEHMHEGMGPARRLLHGESGRVYELTHGPEGQRCAVMPEAALPGSGDGDRELLGQLGISVEGER